jgi:hypothetical protein
LDLLLTRREIVDVLVQRVPSGASQVHKKDETVTNVDAAPRHRIRAVDEALASLAPAALLAESPSGLRLGHQPGVRTSVGTDASGKTARL